MKNIKIRFGVAGNPPNFWKSVYKSDRVNALEWLHSINLDALELQFTHGVKINKERALLFKEKSEEFDIEVTIHAPYFIVLASSNQEKVGKSIERMLKTFEAANWINSEKIIFHPGFYDGDRDKALSRLINNLKQIENRINKDGIYVYPEIGGKISQLGSLDEIITICKEVNIAKPCIDFGHLHAREFGSLRQKEDIKRVFNKIETELGVEELKHLHCHFYPVDYNEKGEVSHKAFHDLRPKKLQLFLPFIEENDEDEYYYPRYEPFIEAIVDFNLKPTIICEAKDSQDTGALLMRNYYLRLIQKRATK